MRVFLSAVALLLLMTACGDQRVDETCECGFYTLESSPEEKLHWPDGTQVKFKISQDVPETLRPALLKVAHTYDGILEKTKLSFDDKALAPSITGDDVQRVSGDRVNTVYWLNEPWPWNETNSESDAMTVVLFAGGQIVEADVFFRAQSYPLPGARSPTHVEPAEYDISEAPEGAQWMYVIGLHEFGHVMGRVHSPNKMSIMYTSTGTGFATNDPFPLYDLNLFSSVYSLRSGVIANQ